MTADGLVGVPARDAGAASGVVNTAHQLGSALGLGILVAVSTTAADDRVPASAQLLTRVTTALTGGSVMLAVALVIVLALIARPAQPSG